MALSLKQEAFCKSYAANHNATQAALDAGYSPKTARAQGSRLLTNVDISARIAQIDAEAVRKAGLTADEIADAAADLATAEITDVLDVSDGAATVKDSADWPQRARRAISRIRIARDGSISIDMASKIQPLELLARMSGADKPTVRDDDGDSYGVVELAAVLPDLVPPEEEEGETSRE